MEGCERLSGSYVQVAGKEAEGLRSGLAASEGGGLVWVEARCLGREKFFLNCSEDEAGMY